MNFTIYDETTAPESSQPILKQINQAFGFVPNALAVLSESSPTLGAYLSLDAKCQETSFSPQELQALIVAISRENECHYCVAAHSTQASMVKLPEEDIQRLRSGNDPADPKLSALTRFGKKMVQKRGWVDENDINEFLQAGYSKANIFEVVLVIAMKTITNYCNHISGVPVDSAFSDYKWSPEK